MPTKIIYLPMATHIAMGLEETIAILSAKVMAPKPEDNQLWPEDIMPLVDAVRDLTELAGKVEAMTQYFEYRVSAFEGALASGAAKPSSDFASQLDQRLTATQDLLRAVLDRLDENETALIRLYKPPFLAIDEHDKPRKELAQLRAKFDVACPEKPGPGS